VKAAEYTAAAPISATSNIFSDPTTANTALHAVPALIAALPGIETSVVRGVQLASTHIDPMPILATAATFCAAW
jgi:hypothetical protein